MKRTVFRVWILAFLFFHSAHGAFSPPNIGEEGVVRTVLQGSEPVDLPIRYLGTVAGGVGPGIDLHLVELTGPVGEGAGIFAGMSGSPVYFRGEMVGALAYRLGRMPKKAVGGFVALENIRQAARMAGGAEPIATSLSSSGVAPEVMNWLEDALSAEGIPIAGSSYGVAGDRKPGTPAPALRAGSPVGVALVRGDLNISATGTVTFLEGDTVYAFGHSFLGMGEVRLPMLSASVVHVLEDQAGSSRLTNVGDEIGSFLDDRSTAIVGRLGVSAETIPLSLTLSEPDGRTESLQFEIARHRRLTPAMVGAAAAAAVTARVRFESDVTVLVEGSIHLAGGRKVPLDMAFSSKGQSLGILGAAGELQKRIGELYSDRFEAPKIRGIDLDLNVDWEVRSWELRNLMYDRGPVSPGQRLQVGCMLAGPENRSRVEELTIQVPESVPSGSRLTLAVGTPAMIDTALGHPIRAARASAPDLDRYLEALSLLRSPHRLTAVLFLQKDGAVVEGKVLEGLPPSAVQWIAGNRGKGTRSRGKTVLLRKEERALDGPLSGGLMVRLEVR